MLDEALELSATLQTQDSPERAKAWVGLARVEAAQGQCSRALALWDQARQYWTKQAAPDSAGRIAEATTSPCAAGIGMKGRLFFTSRRAISGSIR